MRKSPGAVALSYPLTAVYPNCTCNDHSSSRVRFQIKALRSTVLEKTAECDDLRDRMEALQSELIASRAECTAYQQERDELMRELEVLRSEMKPAEVRTISCCFYHTCTRG